MTTNDDTRFVTCPECQGLRVCPICLGRARTTHEQCECWWRSWLDFDASYQGRCGECGGCGEVEVPKPRKE